MSERPMRPEQQVSLVELVDRVLDKGVVLSGDITLAVADVDLVHVGLRALLTSVAAEKRGQPSRTIAEASDRLS